MRPEDDAARHYSMDVRVSGRKCISVCRMTDAGSRRRSEVREQNVPSRNNMRRARTPDVEEISLVSAEEMQRSRLFYVCAPLAGLVDAMQVVGKL